MRRGWLKRRTLHRVVVHTTEGSSFEAMLWKVTSDGAVLTQATYMDESGGGSVKLDGTVFIPKAKVYFVQVREAVPE
jgi:hypothetical protein